MQLGSLELQIFVALVLVLGSAFVALVCDFLKGNNEQLRERNIELRVRQDERERLGLFEPLAHPITWLQGLASLVRNPGMAEAMAGGATTAAAPPQAAPEEAPAERAAAEQPDLDNLTGAVSTAEADRNPQRRHRYDEAKAAAKQQPWATKDELEQLAGRAARIRARHEASHRKYEEPSEPAEAVETPAPPAMVEAPRRPKVAELPKLEQTRPVPIAVAPPVTAPVEEIAEPPAVAVEPPPPPMEDSPAITSWQFRPVSESPKAPDVASEATELVPPVVKPEAPALVSSLPAAVETVEEPLAIEAVAEPESTPTIEEPMIDIWRRPAASEPVRTRIQAVEVPTMSEAVTEDTSASTPVRFEMAPPVVEVQAAETSLPSLDVAALQKATGESRPEGRIEIPAGLHESPVLSQMIENQAPYSGVVVAIGLNDYETLREKLASGTDSVAALNKMVLSMLRPQDFACRFQDDEYILIYPGERGSSAQRRLFQVSEKLWDFQLRSLGNLSVMFSWGGLEVTNETLAEAVASARERMYQTKRNRKPSSLEFAVGRKKVVNG